MKSNNVTMQAQKDHDTPHYHLKEIKDSCLLTTTILTGIFQYLCLLLTFWVLPKLIPASVALGESNFRLLASGVLLVILFLISRKYRSQYHSDEMSISIKMSRMVVDVVLAILFLATTVVLYYVVPKTSLSLDATAYSVLLVLLLTGILVTLLLLIFLGYKKNPVMGSVCVTNSITEFLYISIVYLAFLLLLSKYPLVALAGSIAYPYVRFQNASTKS